MWIFTSNAFISVVADRNNPRNLMVRARVEGDLERIFGKKTKVERTERADYLFRASVKREKVARKIATALLEVGYPNFKDTVRERARHDAYMGVWSEMNHLQRQKDRRRRDLFSFGSSGSGSRNYCVHEECTPGDPCLFFAGISRRGKPTPPSTEAPGRRHATGPSGRFHFALTDTKEIPF